MNVFEEISYEFYNKCSKITFSIIINTPKKLETEYVSIFLFDLHLYFHDKSFEILEKETKRILNKN